MVIVEGDLKMEMKDKVVLKEYIRSFWPRKTITLKDGTTKIIPGFKYVHNGIPFEQNEKGPKIGVAIALSDGSWGVSLAGDYLDYTPHLPTIVTRATENGKQTKVVEERPAWTKKQFWKFGEEIAILRAKGEMEEMRHIPEEALRSITNFENRVKRYFKKEA